MRVAKAIGAAVMGGAVLAGCGVGGGSTELVTPAASVRDVATPDPGTTGEGICPNDPRDSGPCGPHVGVGQGVSVGVGEGVTVPRRGVKGVHAPKPHATKAKHRARATGGQVITYGAPGREPSSLGK